MTEQGRDHLFTPQEVEHKRPTFIRKLETQTILYSSIPTQNPRGREASFLANVDPGLELEIEGISWQQLCSKRNPKKKPNDVWVLAKVVSPNTEFEGRDVYVTMGDLARLPESKKKENQPKQKKLTNKTKPEALDQESKTTEEKPVEYFIQKVRTPVKILFEETDEEKQGEWGQVSTHGEIDIKVEGTWEEIWKEDRESHYIEGYVTRTTKKEDFPLFKKRVIVSKGEASRKPKGWKKYPKQDKDLEDIPF